MEPKVPRTKVVKGYERPVRNTDWRAIILTGVTIFSCLTTGWNVFSIISRPSAVDSEPRNVVIYGRSCDLTFITFTTDTSRDDWRQVSPTGWVWHSPTNKLQRFDIPPGTRIVVYLTVESTPISFYAEGPFRIETDFLTWRCGATQII